MIKKRIIGTIVVRNNLAVQSFGYNKYLPLGKPEILAKNLERWCVDEILILDIDRSKKNLQPNIDLLKSINSIGLNTPIIYGGGISSYESCLKVFDNGADRILVENIVHKNLNELDQISSKIGSQSLILSFPLIKYKNELLQYNYISKKTEKLSSNFLNAIQQNFVSEILIIDNMNEGYFDKFNIDIIKMFPFKNFPKICFGGIVTKKKVFEIIKHKSVSAIAIGNSLNYTENSLQNLKSGNLNKNFRPKDYQ